MTGSTENGPTMFFMTFTILVLFASSFFTDVIGGMPTLCFATFIFRSDHFFGNHTVHAIFGEGDVCRSRLILTLSMRRRVPHWHYRT